MLGCNMGLRKAGDTQASVIALYNSCEDESRRGNHPSSAFVLSLRVQKRLSVLKSWFCGGYVAKTILCKNVFIFC